jgi:4-oxalocrotonate tautomerase
VVQGLSHTRPPGGISAADSLPGLLIIAVCFCICFKDTMPTYHIEMFEGRTPEQKKKLVAEITRVTVEVLGGSPDSVDIIISDIKRENWATGGRLWSEPRS